MTHLSKQTIRSHVLARRAGVFDADARAASNALARVLPDVVSGWGALAGYVAMRGEIDISDALVALHDRGHAICLPVIVHEDAPLAFRHWHPGGALEKGMLGTMVPTANEPPVLPDIILTPLVAFDAKGNRLGYGAGYYDRTLARLRDSKPSLIAIGVAYSLQQVEEIPHEAHDQRLDMIVTEKEVLRFS